MDHAGKEFPPREPPFYGIRFLPRYREREVGRQSFLFPSPTILCAHEPALSNLHTEDVILGTAVTEREKKGSLREPRTRDPTTQQPKRGNI